MRPLVLMCEEKSAWLRGKPLAGKYDLGGCVVLRGRPTMKLYLVKISLPSLVACKRYTAPLWTMETALLPRSSSWLSTKLAGIGALCASTALLAVCAGLAVCWLVCMAVIGLNQVD